MKKLLAIYGSPRENGNSDILLNEAIKGAKTENIKIENIFVRDLKINPCKECNYCNKTGKCIQNDDMQSVYEYLENSDYVIVATPIFFYGLPGNLKNLIDRCQSYWSKKYILKQYKNKICKLGGFISVGGTKGKKLFDGAILTIKYFFDVFNFVYYKDLLVRKIDSYQEILNYPDILEKAYNLGKEIVTADRFKTNPDKICEHQKW